MRDFESPMWPRRVAGGLLLVRILVGWVFVSEGVQKFLFPAQLGVGRFEKIGIPAPQFMAPFVGSVEIAFGCLLLIGLLTRLSTIPLLGVISVAILTTKIPMLAKAGVWAMLHEARTDFSMLLGLVFLLIVGGGSLSLDALRTSRNPTPSRHDEKVETANLPTPR
jgi:putative oxidoreductase